MNRSRLPRVIANFAMTVDGKTSTRNRTPAQFTSPRDKRRLLEIRAMGDAVMVGRSTLVADTMSMRLTDQGLRSLREAKSMAAEPLRVIVSNSGRLPSDLKVFQPGGSDVVVFVSSQAAKSAIVRLEKIARVHVSHERKVSVRWMLDSLSKDHGVRTVVCEGGPKLFRSLVEAGAVGDIYITVAPKIFGGAGAPTLTGVPGDFLAAPAEVRLVKMETIGSECYLHYTLRR